MWMNVLTTLLFLQRIEKPFAYCAVETPDNSYTEAKISARRKRQQYIQDGILKDFGESSVLAPWGGAAREQPNEEWMSL